MHLEHLLDVDGELVHDLDPSRSAAVCAPVQVADGLDSAEAAATARAMTWTMALLDQRTGGAAVTVRPRLLDGPKITVEKVAGELATRHGTSVRPCADIGTTRAGLGAAPAVLDDPGATALGAVTAAAAWRGDLDGARVAIEGCGQVGLGLVERLLAAGARVVAVSTERGAVARSSGFSVDELTTSVAEHGPQFVVHTGLDVHRPEDLFELVVDVIVPGAHAGVVDAPLAARVQAPLVVPVSASPYTAAGLAELRTRGVVALPGFVTGAGARVADTASRALPEREIAGRVERIIGGLIADARAARVDPHEYAVALARTFLATWQPTAARSLGLFGFGDVPDVGRVGS